MNSILLLLQLSHQNNEDALNEIINKFKPLIKKLSNRLEYEEAETDLIISFIQIINRINPYKLKNTSEGALVNYISRALNNKSIDLFKKNVLKKTEMVELNLNLLKSKDNLNTVVNKVFVEEIFKSNFLTNNQKEILKYRYLYDKSDEEIGLKLHISRQAVNQTRKRGIDLIRKYYNV